MEDLAPRLARALSGRYTLKAPLGEGGMAVVWRARDERHGRSVAVKVLRPEIGMALSAERFQREIAIVAALQHPHVLPLLDSGSDGDLLWYVTPLVEGETLRRRLDREGQLPIDDAVRLGSEIAAALDYSHRQGIVHRDIKPENVLLADGHAVVADFGIARIAGEPDARRLTETGVTLSTPAYASPEQVSGGIVDGRSDQYALACVVYEMVTARPPFHGAPAASLAYQHLSVAPRPVTELRPAAPLALAEVVARGLQKTPADRYATAAQLGDALRASLTAATPAPRLDAAQPTGASVPAAAQPTGASVPAAAQPTGTSVPAAAPATAPSRPTRRLAAAALVAAVVVAAIAAVAIWRDRDGGVAASAARRPWVWVAEFEGPADEPDLARATRDLVIAAIDQSGLVAAVPDEQVHSALHLAVLPETTRVTASLARELAVRTAVPVVVEGRIGRVGGGYVFVLRATRPEDGGTVVTVDETTRDAQGLLAAVDRAARALRRSLGERGASLTAEPIGEVITPSFEAFKHFARGRRLINTGRSLEAIPELRSAVALDGAFASAWAAYGTAQLNLVQIDSARVTFARALSHPDRLTAERRFDVESKLATMNGDHEGAVRAISSILRATPNPADRLAALNNRALALVVLGRFEEAAEDYRQALTNPAVQPVSIAITNAFELYVFLRRPAEAESLALALDDVLRASRMAQVAALRGRWAAAESLARRAADAWQRNPNEAGEAAALLGAILARRGELKVAATTLDRFERELATPGPTALAATPASWARWWVAELGVAPVPAELPEWMHHAPVGLRVANALASGRIGEARALGEARIRAIRASGNVGAGNVLPALLELLPGFEAWKQGRWAESCSVLAPFARQRGVPDYLPLEWFRGVARWRVAHAFERLGQPDSAVAYLTLLIEPPGNPAPTQVTAILIEPFVLHRLALLHARAGNATAARRAYDRLAATFTRPDPDRVAWLDEAREAVQAAAAMQAAERR